MAKYWGTPHFSPKIFFQNDSEWLEMDFKPNVTFITFFFEGVP